jgi:hypothetical protein
MTVRVIRILEYVYPDHETAEEDMRRWNVPENGSVRKGGGSRREGDRGPAMVKGYIITSATMSPRTVSADETVPLLDNTFGKGDVR